MLDYEDIKALATAIGRPVRHLLALSEDNDPFYASRPRRAEAARWFADLWKEHGDDGSHLRRLHYILVSQDSPILLPKGGEYLNTEGCWTFLCGASLAARYLDLIPFDALIDRRNDEPMLFAGSPRREATVSCRVLSTTEFGGFEELEFPYLPWLDVSGFEAAGQDYIVEVWVEKSTQNDWLIPLCRRRGVNLVVGLGEQSETRSRELAQRSSECGAPVRVIYISDFDPGGRSMPKAVARKVEFTRARFDLEVDLQLIPLALTPQQCRDYNLPRTPIKESEKRRGKFEQVFGIGATELDAMEALHPGELARLFNAELDNWLDADLPRRVAAAKGKVQSRLSKIRREVEADHAEEIAALQERLPAIQDDLNGWQEDIADLHQTMAEELKERRPDLSDVEIPSSEAPGETDKFVLYDSRRSYVEQMDAYNAWRDGDETAR